jgi:hypothetical protein
MMSFINIKFISSYEKKGNKNKDNLVININFNQEYIITINKYKIERKIDIPNLRKVEIVLLN